MCQLSKLSLFIGILLLVACSRTNSGMTTDLTTGTSSGPAGRMPPTPTGVRETVSPEDEPVVTSAISTTLADTADSLMLYERWGPGGLEQVFLDLANGRTSTLSQGYEAQGWSPSGQSLLLTDSAGGIFIANSDGTRPALLVEPETDLSLSRAWWLSEKKILIERGDPDYEIELLDLATQELAEFPRENALYRHILAVSPLGDWWIEFDEMLGETLVAYPDGGLLDFIVGYVPAASILSDPRTTLGFSIAPDASYAVFPYCGPLAGNERELGCQLLVAPLTKGHARETTSLFTFDETIGARQVALSPDGRWLAIVDDIGERYLLLPMNEKPKLEAYSWSSHLSSPVVLWSPDSNYLATFEFDGYEGVISAVEISTGEWSTLHRDGEATLSLHAVGWRTTGD